MKPDTPCLRLLLLTSTAILITGCGGSKSSRPPVVVQPPVIVHPVPRPLLPWADNEPASASEAPYTYDQPTEELMFALFGNERKAERLTALPITTSTPYAKQTLYVVEVDDVRTGDLLDCQCEMQFTSEHSYNVMLAGQIRISKTPPGPNGELDVSFKVTEANGQNFNREEHHLNETRVGRWLSPGNYDRLWVYVSVWSASTLAKPGDLMTVDAQGRMSVLRMRNPESQGA